MIPATSCNLEPFNKKYSFANPKQFETATWSFTAWDETLTARLWDIFRIFTLPNPLRSQATGDRCLNSPLSWTHHTNTNKHQQKHWFNDITCITCCVPNTLNSWSQGFSVLSLYQNLPISSDPGESHGDSSVGLLHRRHQGGPLQPVAAKMEAQPRRGPGPTESQIQIETIRLAGGSCYKIFGTFPDLEIFYQPPNVLKQCLLGGCFAWCFTQKWDGSRTTNTSKRVRDLSKYTNTTQIEYLPTSM